MEFLIAGIVATVSGIFGGISWYNSNERDVEKLETQKEQLEESYANQVAATDLEYKHQKESAFSAFEQQSEQHYFDYKQKQDMLKNTLDEKTASLAFDYDQTVEKLEANQELTEKSLTSDYNLNDEAIQTEFAENKKEANYEADVADKADTYSEWQYAKELNSQLDVLRATQQSYANSFNQSQVSSGRDYGDALSAAASSGTRTSSMNTAIDLDKATNSNQLMLSQKLADAEIGGQYSNYLLENAKNTFALQQSRDSSNYLRNLYEEGGKEYNLALSNRNALLSKYKNSLDILNEETELGLSQALNSYDFGLYEANNDYNFNYKQNKKAYELEGRQAWELYNLTNKQLGESHKQELLNLYTQYKHYKSNIQDEIDYKDDIWYKIGGTSAKVFTAGTAGFETGVKAYDFFSNSKSSTSTATS